MANWVVAVSVVYCMVTGGLTLNGQNDHLWVGFKNKLFLFVAEPMTWMDAQSVCSSFGGSLATVSDENEKNFIRSMTHVSKHDVWLGGTDILAEGLWTWIGNMKPISYTYWYSNEPAGGTSENCLLWHHYNGTYFWHDVTCNHKASFVCQHG